MTEHHHAHDHSTLRDGLDSAKAAVSDAAQTTREKAREVAHQTAHAAEANPLAIVAGGVALGALIGAVVPRSAKEKELLAPVGKRLGATALAAFSAAKESGKSELQNIGLTKGGAKEQVKTLLQNVAGAAATAGKAAASAGKDELRHAGDKPVAGSTPA
ncbi:hypothetical protein [Sphingomonas sp. Mn802worker]|uniref:hypothetical protein n=1 Tax=Sphingomonas sp. Mn802worker TaxID=629773 RepID=UPI00036F612D|nr:hypothetical protein [Sphingomonas sp. Mn802worker]